MALENLDTDAVDPHFWANPPWADGRGKYRMGLAPIELDQWLSRPIRNPLRLHKQTLLTNRYASVVATTSYSQNAQATLAEQMQVSARDYPDAIADCALSVADDLCLIESSGAQRGRSLPDGAGSAFWRGCPSVCWALHFAAALR